MLPVDLSAQIFAVAAVLIAGLHLVLILGAPIGFMTMGGRHPGVLPPSARVASLLQGVLILCLAFVVLKAAGLLTASAIPGRGWWLWGIVGLSALSLIANTITPSPRERWFGIPATLALLVGSLGVTLGE